MKYPIKFLCPNCGLEVTELSSESQMMVQFSEIACSYCGHAITHANIVNQVKDYAMQHFNKIFNEKN